MDAQLKGIELNTFTLDAYGVPYGYTPVLVALPEKLKCVSGVSSMDRVQWPCLLPKTWNTELAQPAVRACFASRHRRGGAAGSCWGRQGLAGNRQRCRAMHAAPFSEQEVDAC